MERHRGKCDRQACLEIIALLHCCVQQKVIRTWRFLSIMYLKSSKYEVHFKYSCYTAGLKAMSSAFRLYFFHVFKCRINKNAVTFLLDWKFLLDNVKCYDIKCIKVSAKFILEYYFCLRMYADNPESCLMFWHSILGELIYSTKIDSKSAHSYFCFFPWTPILPNKIKYRQIKRKQLYFENHRHKSVKCRLFYTI